MIITTIPTILTSTVVFMLANDDTAYTDATRSRALYALIMFFPIFAIIVSRITDTVFIIQQERLGKHTPSSVQPMSTDDDHSSPLQSSDSQGATNAKLLLNESTSPSTGVGTDLP